MPLALLTTPTGPVPGDPVSTTKPLAGSDVPLNLPTGQPRPVGGAQFLGMGTSTVFGPIAITFNIKGGVC